MRLRSFEGQSVARLLPWLTAAAWLVAGIASLLRDQPTHALDAWMLVPLTLTYLTCSIFAWLWWTDLPRYGRAGFGTLTLAAPPMVIGQLAAYFDWDSFKWLGFPVAILGWTIGAALFGVALARASFAARWAGYAIALAQPAAIITGVALSPVRELSDYGSYTGAIGHGAIWLAIAWRISRGAQPLVAASDAKPRYLQPAKEAP
jgi:hypothetical protein